jgi:hypothetical protein
MSFRYAQRRHAFTILEIVLVVGIIFLIFLALLPAFKRKGSEPRYVLRPASTPAATPIPVPKAIQPPPDVLRELPPIPELAPTPLPPPTPGKEPTPEK